MKIFGDSDVDLGFQRKFHPHDYAMCLDGHFLDINQWGTQWGRHSELRPEAMGSPIPYLFLLCTKGVITKGVISLLRSAEATTQAQGIQVCRGALVINHLFAVRR